MAKALRALSVTAIALSALLVGAAKSPPQPANFVPALSYQYGTTDLRLSNADGSQAVLLVRMLPGPNTGRSVLHHALAPLGQRQVAFVYARDDTSNELRIVDWTQPTPGGPLSVTLDPKPLFTITASGAEITSVDYSPDGTQIAAVSWVRGQNQELRYFDVATRTQIGGAILLAHDGASTHWRTNDGSLLMRGTSYGFSIYKNGVQTALFNTGSGGYFDPFNGSASDVIIQNNVGGVVTLQRWDGVTINNGTPTLVTLTQGFRPSVSCDNASMIFQQNTSRSQIVRYSFGLGTESLFSRDSSISLPTYPNSCA